MAKRKDVIISNPIYDAVFKNLMTTGKSTNKDIAGYFVGTILGEEITDIDFLPQEYTYHKRTKKKIDVIKEGETLSSIRLDFVATIRTKSGEDKKIMIEIQKASTKLDLIRFRTYLGEQYKQENTITKNGEKINKSLPLVVIYMLGFTLPKIEGIVVKVNRTYLNVIDNVEEKHRCNFIECLTHDGYFIQIPRLNKEVYSEWESRSALLQMLSFFEQDYFTDKKENFLKKYPYSITNKYLKKMLETLEYLAADPKVRRAMQEEYWAELNETLWEKQVEELTSQNATQFNQIMTQSNQITTQSNQITTLSNQNTTLSNQNTTLSNQNTTLINQVVELQRLLKQAGVEIPSA